MIKAVLNPESDGIGLVIIRDDKIIIDEKSPMYGRDAAELPLFLAAELKKHDLSVDDVNLWSVGAGPGSFTALRMTAALVGGLCFGHGKNISRLVPGAIAIGAALNAAENSRIGVLYDGRNKEILYFGLKIVDHQCVPTGETQVLNAEQAKEFFARKSDEIFVLYSGDRAAVEKIIPETVKLHAVDKLDNAALAKNNTIAYDDDLTKLVYIRPAVYGHND